MIHLSAQESRWGFGTEVGYGSFSLTNTPGNLIQPNGKSGYHSNILASYRIGERVILSAGFGSIKINYDVLDYAVTFGCDHNGRGGFDQYNSFLIAKDETFGMAIPIFASIYLGKKENQFYLKPGLTFLKFIRDGYRHQFYECKMPTITNSSGFYNVSRTQWQSELNVGFEFGLDFPYKYLKRIQYRIEFGAKYFLSSAFDVRWDTGSFWSWGGTFGVRYDIANNRSDDFD